MVSYLFIYLFNNYLIIIYLTIILIIIFLKTMHVNQNMGSIQEICKKNNNSML